MQIVCFLLLNSVLSLSPASWIGDSLSIIGNRGFKNLTIPGTHDSGTYYLTEDPMPGDASALDETFFKLAEKLGVPTGYVAKQWGMSQDETFYQQMLGGIRYFDVRSGWNKTTKQWVTHHFVIGSPVQYLLQNISQYLQDYPKEIVIVRNDPFPGVPQCK